MIAAVYGPPERFAGDSLAFLRAVVSGEMQNPDPVRLGAAMRLADLIPKRSPMDAPVATPRNGLKIDVNALTPEQRAVLLQIVQSGAVRRADGEAVVPRTIEAEAPATPAPETDTRAANCGPPSVRRSRDRRRC